MQTLELEIQGIVSSPNPVINKGTGFIPLDVAQNHLVMEGGVTEIALALPGEVTRTVASPELIEELEQAFPDLVLVPWDELAKDFVAIAEMKTSGSQVLIFLIFVIAAVGISNTMLIAVFERVREIGMMRALGMSDSSIRLNFVLEAFGIGLVGSLLGLALGAVLTYWCVNWGIDYTDMIGDMDIGYRIHGVFRAAWHPQAMLSALFMAPLVSMVIALLPASRALKMKIADCLRYE